MNNSEWGAQLATPKKWRVGPQICLTEVAKPELWTFLHLLHLTTGAHIVFNLLLEGPDHKEEVGANHPPEDAADDVYDVEADEGI